METKEKNINYHYDKEADVLYASIGKPQKSIYEDEDNGIVLRIDPDSKLYIGFTIIHYMKRINRGMLKKVPHFEWAELPKYN